MSSVRRFFSLWSSGGGGGGGSGGAAAAANGSSSVARANGTKTKAIEGVADFDDDADSFALDTWNPSFASDPGQWEREFDEDWRQLRRTLQQPVRVVRDVRIFDLS